ncbi:MAG TPA: hypothetical protein VN715_08630 [Roseiarcus sp.]|nr:hypothetical protein [Roseiarcus sp.]
MQIKIDARELGRFSKEIERLQRQIPQGVARGLNEGGDKVRTQVQHALQRQAGFKRYSSVTTRTRTARAFAARGDVTKAVQGSGVGQGMSYQIIVSGKASKPFEFKAEVKKGAGGGVTVWFWGEAHKFKRSFEGSGKIAGQLLMRKLGGPKDRLPTRSFDGPNLAKEAVKAEAAETFFRAAETEVAPAVLKQIAKELAR